VTETRLDLTRRQVLAFRRQAGALGERRPSGSRSLRRAAWAGRQDSMPRAAILSIHARVEGTVPSTWEDPALVQPWGPRYNVFVVAACDLPVFSLGTLPDDARGLNRAEDLAARLHAVLGDARMTYGEAGHALSVNPNSLRYAAATGTVLIRWEGARLPVVWTVPPPQVSPGDARLELARRYLHIYGPATPEAFRRWAGISLRSAASAFEALGGSLTPVRTPVGEAWILTADEAALRAEPGRGAGPAAAQRGRLFPALRGRPRPAGPGRRPAGRALDVAGLARRRSRRGRDRRDLAAGGPGDDGAALAAAIARRTRRGHRGGRVPAATRTRGQADRRPLGRMKRLLRPPTVRSGPGPAAPVRARWRS
jgi:hypothetical protein